MSVTMDGSLILGNIHPHQKKKKQLDSHLEQIYLTYNN